MSILKVATIQNSAGTEVFTSKAWINFNGTGVIAIRAGGNVSSSVTDNGNGDYVVNFTTALQDASYAAAVATGQSAGTVADTFALVTLATGSLRIQTSYLSGTSKTLADYATVAVSIFR